MNEVGNLYGLFIGINRYESEGINPLSFAAVDVLAIKERFVKRFNLREQNAVVLVDDGRVAPTRREILRAISRLSAAPMTQADTFVLVFAGHGFAFSGKTYLAATDSEVESEKLLRETAIPLESVRDFLADIAAGQQILILDACRNAPFKNRRSVGGNAMSEEMTRDMAAVIKMPVGRPLGYRVSGILCSCWEGQVAHEYKDGRHGWFCHNLLAEIDSMEGEGISLAELHSRTKKRMAETAWQLLSAAKDQTPYLLFEGDVPVLGRVTPLDKKYGSQHAPDEPDVLPMREPLQLTTVNITSEPLPVPFR